MDIQGTIYQRTREHLRPRSQSEVNVPPSAGSNLPRTLTPVQSSKGTLVPNVRAITSPQLAEGSPKGSVPTRDNAKISAVRSLADICFLHVLIWLITCIILSVCVSVFLVLSILHTVI